MIINICSPQSDISYDIVVQRGIINHVKEYFDLDRKILIVTDDKVPEIYIKKVRSQIRDSFLYVIKSGESSKNIENFKNILCYMLENKFTRTDAVIAIGGGVVGDLLGFVASSYMRGVDFYNIPTTLLAQVDSSIGGKCAVDFNGVKNSIGAFKFPKAVLIDSDTLSTLDKRQFSAGLAESIKMGMTSDKSLFELIEKTQDIYANIDDVIIKSLEVKSEVVTQDPYEKGLRKVLNFGHTVGHAIESLGNGALLHGECVGIGMCFACSGNSKSRLKKVLEKYHLPQDFNCDIDKVINLVRSDKKATGESIDIIYVDKIGSFEFRKMKIDELRKFF